MKLLSWMHRKPQKDNTSSYKDSAIGSSCLILKPSPNNQEDYARPGNNFKKLTQQPQNQSHHYLKEVKAEETEEINKEESTEIFPGFLTIGTLSMEPITEPATPTFDLSHQKENEDGIPEMKYDMKLINDELEKFLRAEAEEEGDNESSGRNSQESTVTLIDKEKEDEGKYKFVTMQVYPLQGYLLGSSTELLETKQKAQRGKTSLKELFQDSGITHRRSDKKAERTQKQTKKESKSTASAGCAAESFLTVTKLNKIKRLFHKKIHPETSTATKDLNGFSRYETKKILKNSGHSYADSALSCESNRMGCWGTLMKEENCHSKTDMKLSQDAITKNRTIGLPKEMSGAPGWEHWINTDADYLVLELQNEEVHN